MLCSSNICYLQSRVIYVEFCQYASVNMNGHVWRYIVGRNKYLRLELSVLIIQYQTMVSATIGNFGYALVNCLF